MKLDELTLQQLKIYSDLGFFVFPCYEVKGNICGCNDRENCGHPGKHPKVGWKDPANCANTYDDMVEMFSGQYYGSNIAVNCTLSDIWVVDIDTKDGALGMESFGSLAHEHGNPPETLQHVTPSGGFHIFFKQDAEKKIGTTVNSYPGIDLRGVGGYVLLPPSIAPANNWKNKFDQRLSKNYLAREGAENKINHANRDWFHAFEGLTPRANETHIDRQTVTMSDFDDMPVHPDLPSWDELERCLSHIPSDCINIPNQDKRPYITYFKILGAIADACAGRKGLDLAIRWSGAISLNSRTASNYHSPQRVSYEFCRARNGNEQEKNSHGSAGHISSYKTIFHIAQECGCTPNMDWWGGQIKQYRRVSMDCQPPIDNTNPDTTVTNFASQLNVIALEVTDDLKLGEEKPPTMPDLELHGAVSYAYNYINSINPVHAPLLSIIPAICTVSAATNRAFKMENLRSVLFGMNLAPSGGGKNAGIEGSNALISSINCDNYLLSNPRSASALYAKLSENPNTYWVMDEVADKLKPMFDEKAGGFLKEMISIMLSAYSCGGSNLGGMVYKDDENNTDSISNPHLNIFGAMTDHSVQDIIKKDQIRSGFVRRFLLNWSPSGEKKKGPNAINPNQSELNRFNEWRDAIFKEFSPIGNLSLITTKNTRSVELTIQDYDFYESLVEQKNHLTKDLAEDSRAIWQGWEENVKKIAMVLCAGERALYPNNNFILEHHLDTASKIVTNSCQTWSYFFKHHIYDNEIDRVTKLLVKEINNNKGDGVRIPDFRYRHKLSKKFLYDDCINLLVENGGVFFCTQLTKTANNSRRATDFIFNIAMVPEKIKKEHPEVFDDKGDLADVISFQKKAIQDRKNKR